MTRTTSCLLIALAACGNVKNDELPDAGVASDGMSAVDGEPEELDAEVGCLAATTYGAPVVADQTATHANPPDVYYVGGNIDGGGDVFQLQLYAGFGVFASGVVPGTYQITGDEAQFATCGACALVFARFTPDMPLDDPDRVYLATSGSVEISSVTPALTGTVRSLVLEHVTIDTNTRSTVVGDCQTTIDQAAFAATVMENTLVGRVHTRE